MKSFFQILLAIASITLTHSTAAQTYCVPSQIGFNGCWTGEDINSVTIGTFSDLNTGCGNPRYQDRTSVGTIPLTVGATTTFTITSNAGAGLFFGIWIDANGDGDFNDPGEFVWNGLTAGVSSGSFVVPAGSGSRRLRILGMGKTSPIVLTDQCAVSFWGEMQDYTCLLGSAGCPTPSALHANSIIDSSATLAWSGVGTKFRVEYGPTGFTQGNGILDSTTTNSLAVTNLLAVTSYDFYVRNVCSATNQSGWNGPFTFTTRCETVNTYPFVESFENSPWVGNTGIGGGADVFSPCWLRNPSVYNFNTTLFVVRQDAITSPNTGAGTPYGAISGNFLHLMNTFNTGAIATVELPLQNLASLVTPTLKYYYHMFGSGTGKLYVEASTNGGVTWVKLDSIIGQQQTTKTAAWLSKTVDLASVSSTNTNIRFRAIAASNNGDICLDQISISNAPPCPNPTGVGITNILGTSATLNWNTLIGNTYYIEYGPQGFAQGTGAPLDTVSNTASHALTGLASETFYDVYLKARCSVVDTSEWVGPYNFRTFAVPTWVDTLNPFLPDNRWSKAQGTLANPTIFTLTTNSNWTTDGYLNVGTTGAARVGVYSSGTRQDWFMIKTTDLGVGNNYELHFDAGITAVGGTGPATMAPDDKLRIVVSTDNGVTWNLSNVIYDLTPTSGLSNIGSSYIVPLTGYNGLVKFGFYMSRPVTSTLQYDLFIDNIGIRTPSGCQAPTAVNTTSITSNSISLAWSGGANPGTFDVEYGPEGFIQGTGTLATGLTTPSYAATGLMPVTKYDFYLRQQCSSTNSSAWVGPFTLRSGCPTIFSTPYSTDFDNEVNGYPSQGVFTNCWTSLQNTQTYHWRAQTTSSQTNTGPEYDHTIGQLGSGKYLVADALYQGTDAMLLAGPFDLSTLTQPMLQFYYHMFGSDMGTLHVDISTDASTWQNNLFKISGQQQPSATSPWIGTSLPLSNYIGDTVYIRFRGERGNSSQSNIAIDDMSILNAPGCIAPAGLQFVSATATTATVSWATYQNATSVEYGLAGYFQGIAQIARVHNVGTTATLTNLLPGTAYDVYVRDTCNPSIWVGPLTINTACTAGLSGTYTIGGTPGATNFASLKDAINALSYCGVSGPTTINFTGGKHIGFFDFGVIPGASATNTVEFVGTLGADSLVAATFDYLMSLSGTGYVSFKNITFFSPNDKYLVWLRQQTHHITFDNCEFVTGQVNVSTSVLVAATANASAPNSSGKNAEHISIANCSFKNGYHGASIIGDINENSNVFSFYNNTFTNQYQSAIQARYIDSLVVDGNHISNTNGASFGRSIYLINVYNGSINGNSISTISEGILIAQSGSSTNSNTLSNNMIKAASDNISASSCVNLNVYHNTTAGNGIGLYMSGTNSTVSVLNNIFQSGASVAFQATNIVSNFTLNYNIYHRTSPGNIAAYQGNHADLAAWKTAFPALNVNSLQGNPNFISGSDLHVIGSLANNVGFNIPAITTDFDGDTRPMAPSTTVDIGADEYTPKVLDAALISLYEPMINCGGTATSVSVIVKNQGSATITSLPVSVIASGGLTATLSSTFSVNVPFGGTDTLTIGTLNTSALTAPVTLTAYTQLVSDEDVSNDTLVKTINFVPVQPKAETTPAVCVNATVDTLQALPLPGITYGWFASQSAITPADTGNAFGYDPSVQSSWYLGYVPLAFDQLYTTTNLASSNNGGVMFNVEAKKNVAIDSFAFSTSYPLGSNFLFEVYYIANGTPLGNELDMSKWTFHESITATSTGGIAQTMALTTPINIPQGSSYAIYLNYPSYTVPVTPLQPQVYSNSSIEITPANALLAKFTYNLPNRGFSGTIFTHENGCSTTKTLVQTLFNTDTAVASFTTAVSQPNKVDVDANASQGQLVDWDFGDGTSASGKIATHTYTNGGSYTILCTVTDTVCGTTDTATFKVQMTIGIDENALANAISIYPNPSNGVFNISFAKAANTATLEVVNAVGQVIETLKLKDVSANDTHPIDLSRQPSGIYFVRIVADEAIAVKKITKL
jgi:chitodextrinase